MKKKYKHLNDFSFSETVHDIKKYVHNKKNKLEKKKNFPLIFS